MGIEEEAPKEGISKEGEKETKERTERIVVLIKRLFELGFATRDYQNKIKQLEEEGEKLGRELDLLQKKNLEKTQ